jgi:branched-chain amino acid aminotransferase
MATVVSLNGILVPAEDAKVSIFDRAFLYGDSVYEVVRTYEGVPFLLEAHLERLESSARRIGMRLPVDLETFTQEVTEVQQARGGADSYIRIVSTRGSGRLGLDPSLAENPVRMVIAMDLNPPPAVTYEAGAKVALVSVRSNLKDAIDPQAKTGNYLNSVMALAEAKKRGAHEAVMLDHRNYVTEGASSNIFAVLGDTLLTPPLEAGILEGLTRSSVMAACHEDGMRVLELPLTESALKCSDEVFITSSIREIVPIVQVDDQQIGSGRPGPIYARVRRLFDAYVGAYVLAHK